MLRRPAWRGGCGASRSASGGSRRRRAGRRPRPARRAGCVSAGRSSNMLKRLAALLVPSRAQSSTASAAASRSSSRRCCSSGAKRRQDMVDGRPVRLADPDPQPAELLGPELVDDRAQAVVAARPATLAEAQLAERQGEIVGDDEQVDQRGVLARQHLADRQARVVHVGQGLDERQVEAPEAAHGHVRRVALASLARPAGALGDPVHDQPADVVARAGILRAGVAETDDDLQPFLRGQHDRARSHAGRACGDGSRAAPARPTRPSATEASPMLGGAQHEPLEGAHRGLFGRVGVVPAAHVERAVDRQEPQLVGR